jgi:predicted amidohydrolase YtcJ
MRARYLLPRGNSFEVRVADFTLIKDACVSAAFRIDALSDLGLAGPLDESLPWIHSGLFDSHLHLTWIGEIERRVVAESFGTLNDYVGALKDRLGLTPRDEILISYGFDEDRFGLGRDDLRDRVGAQLPVDRKWLLFRVCGHLACASPALLAALGLDPSQTLLDDNGIQLLQARLPAPTREVLKSDFLRAQEKMLAVGISAIGDMSLDEALIPAILELQTEGRIQLEYQGVMIDDSKKGAFLKAPVSRHTGHQHFEIRHWKRYLDGSFGSRTAWLREPYADGGGAKGLQLHQSEELVAAARQALKKGFALSFHAIGDAALEQLIELSAALAPEMRDMNRAAGINLHRIEHAQLMGDDQLLRLKELGLWTICVQPYHRVADDSFIRNRLGEQRLCSQAYRLNSILEAGLPLSIGSDAPITFYDPLRTLEACHHLSFAEALWIYTSRGRAVHGLPARDVSRGARVWILEARRG